MGSYRKKPVVIEAFGPTYTVIYKHHREVGTKLARQILVVALSVLIEVTKEGEKG